MTPIETHNISDKGSSVLEKIKTAKLHRFCLLNNLLTFHSLQFTFTCHIVNKSKMPALYLHVLSILGIIALTTGQEQLLMVFGGKWEFLGEAPTLFPKYRDVHLLSLDGGPPLPWCLQSLNKFPREFGNLWESCPATLGAGELPRMCS